MKKDDKTRVIGKVVAINSNIFTVELLGGLDNFNINGFDDIHYFAQVNSYVILPYQNYYIVAEIISIKERDTLLSTIPTEQLLNKSKAIKYIDITPIGTIKENQSFNFGISVYPPLYSDVLYIKDKELDSLFNIRNVETIVGDEVQAPAHNNTRLNSLTIGRSAIFENYDIKINIDKFFGSHSAILGNTGSGKSCTISSIIQTLSSKNEFSASGSSFIFLDVNGEYQQAFSKLNAGNTDISVITYTLDDIQAGDVSRKGFSLPHWFLSIDEWALLLQASEKTQLPILRNALGLAVLFSQEEGTVNNVKNHILATCITQILRDETSSPSKKDRIKSILQKFKTSEINLTTEIEYLDQNGDTQERFYNGVATVDCTIDNILFIHFGEMRGISHLHGFLESKDRDGEYVFLSDDFKMPTYKPYQKFDFDIMEEALDIAILYEEAFGNRQIRDYCSSMITRFKSLQERYDFKFLRETDEESFIDYRNSLLGLVVIENSESFKKKTQITILDLNSTEDEIVEIVSCVVSRIIYEALKGAEPRNTFPVNLVLEEAHRYISITQDRLFLKANHIFERIAKEGRKYGLFLLISSQRPSELSKTVLSQCSNFIVHRIQNPEDLNHIRQITPHISEAVLKRLPSLPTQQALVFGHAVNLPAIFKVSNADPLPKSDNNKVSENWFVSRDTPIDIKFRDLP